MREATLQTPRPVKEVLQAPKQMFPLQPVEDHVRADIHAAAHGESPKEQVGMP